MRDSFIQYAERVRADLGRPGALMSWGGLLLALYLTGWWHGDFERVALVVVVALFLTAPHARGLIIFVGLAALIWVQSEKWMPPAELKGWRAEIKNEVGNIGKAARKPRP